MKLAFSNVACLDWDLATLFAKAKEFGYEGVELVSLGGQGHLPDLPQLKADPAAVVKLAVDAGVQIVCLATEAAFSSANPHEVAANQQTVREYVDLAAALKCPYVRVRSGKLTRTWRGTPEQRDRVKARIGQALHALAPYAVEHGVTIVIENGGDFPDSPSAWYFVDAADSPAVRCCWNPLTGRTATERPTLSVPRLGSKIALIRVADAKLDEHGGIRESVLPGQGEVDVHSLVQLLKGIAYQGFLLFDWPRQANPSLAGAAEALPAAATYLQGLLKEQPVQLTAYKGDKFKPRQGREFLKT